MQNLKLIVLLCLTLISSQSTGQTRLPVLTQSGVLIDTADWSTVLFGFEYIHHLERASEASIGEIARLDSIRTFMIELHQIDSVKLEEARVVRESLESKVEVNEKELKRQRRGKIWGIIGGVLSGFGAGAGFGWAISR